MLNRCSGDQGRREDGCERVISGTWQTDSPRRGRGAERGEGSVVRPGRRRGPRTSEAQRSALTCSGVGTPAEVGTPLRKNDGVPSTPAASPAFMSAST